MKKILLSTALVVATAGVAAAEVNISGSGRFGLVYFSGAPAGVSSTRVENRLRFNIDASVETESGVTFGGRIRLQDNNNGGGRLSASQVFAKYNGMTLQVGNVDTAYDSVALMYDSEVGYIGSSFGNPGGDYFSFSSGPYAASRNGIFFSYAAEGLNVRVSYVDPNQLTSGAADGDEELGISADYSTGQFTVSAAANSNGAGIDNNDQFFLGAAYKFSDAGTIGLNFIDNGDQRPLRVGDDGRTIVLYGNYKFGATTLRAYVANNDGDQAPAIGPNVLTPNATDTAYGIGVDYDLGGATLAGAIQRGYDEETYADLGVKFSF